MPCCAYPVTGPPLPCDELWGDRNHALREVIGRIHNQGVCGSCWVFAALGPLDSRLCIKTRGVVHNFSGDLAVLSRGYATCCFSEQDDGCDGGWEYMVYDGVERTQGVPTDSCSPYFASPDSAFNETSEAPECPDQCQDTYLRSLDEDYFKPSGVGNYQMVFSPSPEDIELVKVAPPIRRCCVSVVFAFIWPVLRRSPPPLHALRPQALSQDASVCSESPPPS